MKKKRSTGVYILKHNNLIFMKKSYSQYNRRIVKGNWVCKIICNQLVKYYYLLIN